jgi:SAM-dependent methyltransferase
MSFDPRPVRAFEHPGWQQAASAYVLDAARVGAGMQALDLACGPGLVAGAARLRGAMPTGLDFAAAMIGLARTAHPAIRFEEGDAEALPFADASFDAGISNFGIHHVPDPVRALSEARRVLRWDGRMAFTSWAAPAENIAWKLLFDAISAHGDPKAAKTPPSGGGLRKPEDLLRVLDAARFAQIEGHKVDREWRFAAAGDLIEGFRRGDRADRSLDRRPAGLGAAGDRSDHRSRHRCLPGFGRFCRSDRGGPCLGGTALRAGPRSASKDCREFEMRCPYELVDRCHPLEAVAAGDQFGGVAREGGGVA